MNTLKSVSIFAIICVVTARGARYEFFAENEEIFENCPENPGNNGVLDLVDFSDIDMLYSDGSVHVNGNLSCRWEGVQPTDLIKARSDIYKFKRGGWQATPFTFGTDDFCKTQFNRNTVWFQLWTTNIAENDRECLNNYGHVYHHQPFDVNAVFDFAINMEGRHKLVVYVNAFDEHNVKRPQSICFQIVGEFVRLK